MQRVLELRLRLLGTDHEDTIYALEQYSAVVFRRQAYEDAETLFRGLVKSTQNVLGPSHPRTLTARFRLAKSLLVQGMVDDAEACLNTALRDGKTALQSGRGQSDTVATGEAIEACEHLLGVLKDFKPGKPVDF